MVQHCLKLFRQCDFNSIAEYIPPIAPRQRSFMRPRKPRNDNSAGVGDIDSKINDLILSQDLVLSQFAHVLDVPSRRLFPRHLLRRSQVLGSFSVNENTLIQRIALTARNGEESIFEWRLAKKGIEVEMEMKKSDKNPEGWVIESVKYQGSSDAQLPTTPHPRHPPERVIEAQLVALAENDTYNASMFNAWNHGQHGGILVQYDLMKRKLGTFMPPLRHLNLQKACFGAAALVNEKKQLQEIKIPTFLGEMGSVSFLWTMQLAPNGCWMCTDIEVSRNIL